MYRNIVLTIIAVCLVWICARDVAPWRSAEALPGEKLPRREGRPVPVVIQGMAGKPLPVAVQADSRNPVPVSIAAGRGIPVIIQDASTGALRNAGPMDVRSR